MINYFSKTISISCFSSLFEPLRDSVTNVCCWRLLVKLLKVCSWKSQFWKYFHFFSISAAQNYYINDHFPDVQFYHFVLITHFPSRCLFANHNVRKFKEFISYLDAKDSSEVIQIGVNAVQVVSQ